MRKRLLKADLTLKTAGDSICIPGPFPLRGKARKSFGRHESTPKDRRSLLGMPSRLQELYHNYAFS